MYHSLLNCFRVCASAKEHSVLSELERDNCVVESLVEYDQLVKWLVSEVNGKSHLFSSYLESLLFLSVLTSGQ